MQTPLLGRRDTANITWMSFALMGAVNEPKCNCVFKDIQYS